MAKPVTGNRFAAWYARVAAFNVEQLFSTKRPPGPPRTVYVNEPTPAEYLDHKGRVKAEHVHLSNQVITSKYTIITFLPRNLLEQFRRIANIYFLAIAILQFFPKFSTISPGVVILPLLFILAVTAAKDGYEDFGRHQSDKRVNYSTVRVLSGANWSNPNAMKSKSKTFIRGILPNSKSRIKQSSTDKKASDPTVEFDDEGQENLTPGQDDRAHWKKTYWEDLRVGDFVKIVDHEAIPADILICATSEEENVAFVETKNLDGETNLKSRHAVSALTHIRTARDCADPQNAFRINCDRPDVDMYRLNGNVATERQVTVSLDLSMTLLRGTVLRNTTWVIGVVLFTGEDTKIIMNAGGTPSKRSKVERQMNPQVFFNLILLAAMAVVCAIADSSLEKHYYPLGGPWLFRDNLSNDNPNINGLVTWAFALLTFQDIVPISLYISIEFVRTCQAAFIYFDADIWYAKTNQATIARSWNLSDDLGQIEYIFSDKTGTLTQNLMIFRQCSIGGRAYRGKVSDAAESEDNSEQKPPSVTVKKDDVPVEVDVWASTQKASSSSSRVGVETGNPDSVRFVDSDLQRDIGSAFSPDSESNDGFARNLNAFFSVLALCHTVMTGIDPTTGAIQYKAQSPDEAALVQAAADVGYVFLGKERDVLSMQTPAMEVEKYELLNILEFTSARKRMSVILRDEKDGRLFLFTKGADNIIFERLREGGDDLKLATEKHLSEFANDGLRTLTLAYKVISEDEYHQWSERYHGATIAMDNREEQVEAVSSEIERDLRLLGATAIEDRLQDGVPETIADLKRAGIKIWVATGDKMETAIAIGRSTNLIGQDSNIIIVKGGVRRPVHEQMLGAIEQFFPESEEMNEKAAALKSASSPRDDERQIPLRRINTGFSSMVGPQNGERPGGFVLVVDGAALLEAFADEENKAILLRLSMLCEGVICCRVSPLQKALVVKLVKEGLGAMTLAIGDGANDVSMIQAADVGVGISGEEGLQAVNSSDYAIAQFRFLKKLLLVHGHWSYARNGVMILNFFYKNIVPTGILWWFQIYDGWSGNFAFDYIYVLFWNSLWTITPVIGIGLFDRFLDSKVLMELPELYRYGREGTWFGFKSFMVYMFDGVVQSVIIYFLIVYAYVTPTTREDGYDVHQQEFSTTMAISAVMVANLYTGFAGSAWTWWLVFAVFFGIVVVWVFTAIYSAIAPGYAVTQLYGNNDMIFPSAYFWLSIPLVFFLSMAPRYLAKASKFCFYPDDLDIIRYMRKTHPHVDLSGYSRASSGSGLAALQRRVSSTSVVASRRNSRDSVDTLEPRFTRPSMDVRAASRTDMSTGIVSVDRGFDFNTEENGVAMRRIQTNLSEKRASSRNIPGSQSSPLKKGKDSTLSHVFSLRRSLRKRKDS